MKLKQTCLLLIVATFACESKGPSVPPLVTGGTGGGGRSGSGGAAAGGAGGNVGTGGTSRGSGGASGSGGVVAPDGGGAGGDGGIVRPDAGMDTGSGGAGGASVDAREAGQPDRVSPAEVGDVASPRDVGNIVVTLPPPPPSDPCGYPSSRKVPVTDAKTFKAALVAAMPGDLIELAAGSFVGKFDLVVSGSKDKPIVICGPRAAIIDAGGGGYGLHLENSSWVIVSGISVTNGLKNIMLDNSHDNLLSNLLVANSKQEGVHFRDASSRNIIMNSEIRDTGTQNAEFGEGLYIGSAGGSDAAHDNQAINNKFSNNGAECIDIKEGTKGGLIYGNTMDGAGQKGLNFADSLIDLKGNDYLIDKNQGGDAILNAFEVHSIGGNANSGHNNIFRDNVLTVKNPLGVGIWFDVKAMGNVVFCSNKVTGGAGMSTAPCGP